MAPSGVRYGEGAAAATNGGLTLRDPVTGAQYVQIQLLQVRSIDQNHKLPMEGFTICTTYDILCPGTALKSTTYKLSTFLT